jgi:hypothetical protein
MSTQAWDVDVDGAEHRVTVDTDSKTGRTAIRVDGRMAGRTFLASEEERDFSVGSAVYVLRRLDDGTFDLDVGIPDPMVDDFTTRAKNPDSEGSGRRTIGRFILLAALAGTFWWAWQASVYMRASWSEWSSNDPRVVIDFPGEVAVDSRRATARYRDHTYVLEHSKIQPLAEYLAPTTLTKAVKQNWPGADMESISETRIPGRDAVKYVLHVSAQGEHPPATLRGIATVHQDTMYLAWVATPRGEKETADVSRFIRSIKLPREYAYNWSERRAADKYVAQSEQEMLREASLNVRLMGLMAKVAGLILVIVIVYFSLIRR